MSVPAQSLQVPLCNPQASFLEHRTEFEQAGLRVLEQGTYILGREVEAFEKEFAAWLGTAHAVGVANGTDAIELALRAVGVQAGDSVITVSHTAVATAAAISRCGAHPIFVDIDPRTFCMDPEQLKRTLQTLPPGKGAPKAIIPVHLYGHAALMQEILDCARQFDLPVIEDCAQAHGTKIGVHKTGTLGVISAFSFYPTKNLGAFGDGGAIATSDSELAEKVRLLRQYGWKQRYISDGVGFNSRLDELQAAFLRVRLRYLDSENDLRQSHAAQYQKALSGLDLVLPQCSSGTEHTYHLYVVRVREREKLRAHLERQGIGYGIHYPVPVHLQPAYRYCVMAGQKLTHTEAAAQEIVSLPMYPQLSRESIRQVCTCLGDFFTHS